METIAAIIGGMFVVVILGILIALVLGVFWLWMLVDCIKNNKIAGTEKAVWILIVLLCNWVGGIVYYFAIRKGESTGFANFIGLIFVLILMVSLIAGIVYSTKTKTKEDNSRNTVLNSQTDTREPVNKIRDNKNEQQNHTISIANDKKTQTANNNSYKVIHKRDENKSPNQSPSEIANIDISKYSDKLTSWVDSNGKVHFSNTDIRN